MAIFNSYVKLPEGSPLICPHSYLPRYQGTNMNGKSIIKWYPLVNKQFANWKMAFWKSWIYPFKMVLWNFTSQISRCMRYGWIRLVIQSWKPHQTLQHPIYFCTPNIWDCQLSGAINPWYQAIHDTSNSSLLHCKDHTHSWSTGRCIQLLQSGQNHEILAIAIIQGGIHHCLGKRFTKCVKVIKTARRQVLHRLPHTPNASPGTRRGCPTSLTALRGTGCALSGDPTRSAGLREKRRSPAGRRATPNRQGTRWTNFRPQVAAVANPPSRHVPTGSRNSAVALRDSAPANVLRPAGHARDLWRDRARPLGSSQPSRYGGAQLPRWHLAWRSGFSAHRTRSGWSEGHEGHPAPAQTPGGWAIHIKDHPIEIRNGNQQPVPTCPNQSLYLLLESLISNSVPLTGLIASSGSCKTRKGSSSSDLAMAVSLTCETPQTMVNSPFQMRNLGDFSACESPNREKTMKKQTNFWTNFPPRHILPGRDWIIPTSAAAVAALMGRWWKPKAPAVCPRRSALKSWMSSSSEKTSMDGFLKGNVGDIYRELKICLAIDADDFWGLFPNYLRIIRYHYPQFLEDTL